MTLDHVTPRRGQTAYDRRDNLVLCCPACNAQKADQPFLAFLLARRARAASLQLAREIAGPEASARASRLADPDYPYAD